jgi:regulation of enolase protein 1 (concanavalin A-like superfamily)
MTVLTLPSLPFPLEADGTKPCVHTVDEGVLTLSSMAETDLFVDPAGGGSLPDAGRLVGVPPSGDFTLAAKVTVGFSAVYDAGVLLLYSDERRWAKLCFEFSPQHEPTAVTVVTRGSSDDSNSFTVEGETLWLRVARAGRAWAFHASTDGAWWRLLRYFSLDEPRSDRPTRVGFLAQSPTGRGCTAVFEQVSFRSGAPADLRDGS